MYWPPGLFQPIAEDEPECASCPLALLRRAIFLQDGDEARTADRDRDHNLHEQLDIVGIEDRGRRANAP